MEAAVIMLSIGIMIGLMTAIPILANAFATYMKAKSERLSSSVPDAQLNERIGRIERTLQAFVDSRETTMQHSLSVERNLDVIQARLSHLEGRTVNEPQHTVQSLHNTSEH